MARDVVIKIKVEGDADVKQLEKDIRKLANTTKDVDKEAKKASKSVDDVASNGGAIAILDSLTGGLATRLRDAYEASKLFNVSLKGTRTALIATGIGGLVVALGAVVAYWDEIVAFVTQANEKLEEQKALLEQQSNVLDSQLKLNEAEIKFARAQGKNVDALVKKQKELTEAKILTLEAQLAILESQQKVEESKVSELTTWEKIKVAALETAGLYDQARQAAIDAVVGDEEERLAIEKRKQQIIDLRTQLTNLRIGQIDSGNTPGTTRDKQTTIGAKSTEQQDKELEQFQKSFENQFNLKKEQNDALIGLEEGFQAKVLAIDKKTLEGKKQLTDAEVDYRLNTAANLLTALSGLAEEGSAGAKAIAIAQAVISTYQGINKALAETTDFTPSQSLRFANAAAVGIAGFANVANILKQKSSGAITPSLNNASGNVTANVPAFNVVGTSGANQIIEGLQQDQQPIQAFVVGSNVTTQQELDRNIVETASIG